MVLLLLLQQQRQTTCIDDGSMGHRYCYFKPLVLIKIIEIFYSITKSSFKSQQELQEYVGTAWNRENNIDTKWIRHIHAIILCGFLPCWILISVWVLIIINILYWFPHSEMILELDTDDPFKFVTDVGIV